MITRENIIELSKNLKEPQWILDKRLEVFDSMQIAGDKLSYGLNMSADFSALDFDNLDYSFDGVDLSCEGARVLGFASAYKDHKISQILKKQMFKGHHDLASNKFLGLAAAAFTEGYCVIVDKKSPKQLEMFLAQKPDNSFTYIMLFVQPGVRATVLEVLDMTKNHHVIIDVIIGHNSNLNLISSRNFESGQNIFISRSIHLEKDSHFEQLSMVRTQGVYLERVKSSIFGEGASSKLNLGFLASENSLTDLYTENMHIAPDAKSDIMVKGVASDVSQVFYRGLVAIGKGAEKSEGFQKADIISLSEKVKVRAVPLLKIENNNVRCSHGVTTTHLNEDSMFYLQSRGLDYEQAKDESVKAHFSSIEDKLSTYLSNEDDI